MDILNWLNTFQNAWINKDIPVVLSLFSDQIEYWESPYQKVTTKQEIEELWKYIDMQDNIVLSLSLFSSDDDKNTVFWDLTYQKHGENIGYRGVYLIKLDNRNLCTYFMQIGERLQ